MNINFWAIAPIKLLLAIFVITPQLSHADDKIFNPSFELGTDGYAFIRYMRYDTNKQMQYIPAQIDNKDYIDGNQSFKITNPYAEQIRVVTQEFILDNKPDKKYILTFWAKSSKDSQEFSATILSTTSIGWDNKSLHTTLTKEWKQYKLEFMRSPKKEHKYYVVQFLFCQSTDAPACDIWLDKLELSNNDNNSAPEPTVEVSVLSQKKSFISENSTVDNSINIKLYNNSDKPITTDVKLSIYEDHSGNHYDDKAYLKNIRHIPLDKITLQPKKLITINKTVKINKYGGYYIDAEIKSTMQAKSHGDYFTVSGKYISKPINLDKDFCVGLNYGGLFSFAPDYIYQKTAFYGCGGNPEDQLLFFENMGCRIIRTHDFPGSMFNWRIIEPQENNFDFSLTDYNVNIFSKHNISILPVMGYITTQHIDKGAGQMPVWLAKISPEEKLPERIRERGYRRFHFSLEQWRKYLNVIANRYKGTITHYEIMNEPNLSMDAATYTEYLKSGYSELKKVSDDIKVVGFCSTGDLGGKVAEFLNSCFENDGLSFADIVSFHPYDAPKLSSLTPSDVQIDSIKDLINKFSSKKAFPLWNTELYYLGDIEHTGNPNTHYTEKTEFFPHDLAQRFLTDLGEGLQQSIAMSAVQMFKNKFALHYLSASRGLITDMTPNSGYVVYNALARFLEGATPVSKFKWNKNNICYIYQKDKKIIAAFWTFGKDQSGKLKLNFDAGSYDLKDIYGNTLKPAQDALTLTKSPYLMFFKDSEINKIEQSLKRSTVIFDRPLEFSQIRLTPTGSAWNAAIGVFNKSDSEVTASISLATKNLTPLKMQKITLAPKGITTVMIPVKITGDLSSEATIRVFSNNSLWTDNVEISGIQKTITSSTAEGTKYYLTSQKSDQTNNDIYFTASHKDNILTLTISVKDKTPSYNSTAKHIWLKDSIELFFDKQPLHLPTSHTNAYNHVVDRIFIAPYEDQGKQIVVWPADNMNPPYTPESTITTTPEGYKAVISLPFSQIGIKSNTKQEFIGFDICVNDIHDKTVTKSIWNSPDKAYINRFTFGFLIVQ